MKSIATLIAGLVGFLVIGLVAAQASSEQRIEVSSDGLERVEITANPEHGVVSAEDFFPASPDWGIASATRIQVGGLAAADIDSDGDIDLVVGCYHSDSYPPYDDWHNFIYRNDSGELETTPSWTSADQRSTGDIQVALINDDIYPDVFAANGGFEMAPSVVYFGTVSGPSTTPAWLASDSSWTNYALPFDVDHDGDIDVVTANQGNSASDPYRPIYLYLNDSGTLANTPGWQSAESSIQNFLSFGDLDGDGWEDLAVSKWANFSSGVYLNNLGTLATTPGWTTADDDTDKGIGWADVDGDDWPDLALGHDPTQLWENDNGSLGLAWSASGTYFGHSDLRWCDIDGDGDPDLAEVHFANGHVNLYRNDGGVLTTSPVWSYDSDNAGTAVAFGDINGDSQPDLILGTSGGGDPAEDPAIMVFYSRALFADGFESGDVSAWSSASP